MIVNPFARRMAVALALVTLVNMAHAADNMKLLSVRDMLGETIVGDPRSSDWNTDYQDPSVASPDGTKFAVILKRGNVATLSNDAQLLLYRAHGDRVDAAPSVVLKESSRTNYQPIAMLRWSHDGKSLFFGSSRGTDPFQVFRVDIADGKETQITHAANAISGFAIDPNDRGLVTFETLKPSPQQMDAHCISYGCRVTADTLYEADYGASFATQLTYYALDTGKHWPLVQPSSSDGIGYCYARLEGGVSSDGRFGVQMCQVTHAPADWRDYVVDTYLSRALRAGNPISTRKLFLYDFLAKRARPLIDAPVSAIGATPIVWLHGGREVLVVGALQPLANSTGSERNRRARSRGLLSIDIKSGAVTNLLTFPDPQLIVKSARWSESDSLLVLDAKAADGSTRTLAYKLTGQSFVPAPVPAVQTHPVTLVLRQSPNERATLWQRSTKDKRESLLLDPNRWLESFALGRVEHINWPVGKGPAWSGLLYYPPHYASGHRYPLLLQTHGGGGLVSNDVFSLEGVSNNYAAQPTAARGIVVLVVEEVMADSENTPREWPTVQAGYEGAIDYLAKRGLIDRTRVATQGWSRSGPWTAYFITHTKYPVAAGAFTETADMGWFSYLTSNFRQEIEMAYGAKPFGDGLRAWAQLAPSFNLDRVHTPMLMWSPVPSGLWDWFAGLRRLGKPVEYWNIPSATHDLTMIGQRLNTNELLVDWFDFWLNDHEDPSPSKRAQYQRWEKYRATQSTTASQ